MARGSYRVRSSIVRCTRRKLADRRVFGRQVELVHHASAWIDGEPRRDDAVVAAVPKAVGRLRNGRRCVRATWRRDQSYVWRRARVLVERGRMDLRRER
jgi:hypothetical protein